jgi:hypothetical protein
MFLSIMKKALTGKQSDFELVKSWSERCIVKDYIRGVNTVITIFTNLEKKTYKTYLDQIDSGTQDLGVILAIKQFNQCKKFYKRELDVALDMLDEYNCYVWSGHILDTLVGNRRKEEDLIDYRTLPLRIF